MGTNFYVEKPRCQCCGRRGERLHVGKRSGGWRFLFRSYPDGHDFPDPPETIGTARTWRKLISGNRLVNEYGDEIPEAKFWKEVEGYSKGKSHIQHARQEGFGGRGYSIDDEGHEFLSNEFC